MQSTTEKPASVAGVDDYEPSEELDLPLEPEPGEDEIEPDLEDGEPEVEVEPLQPAAPERRPGRRERQSAEIRELRETVRRLERETRERQQQPPASRIDPAEQARRDQAERDYVAQLPYEQQSAYWYNKQRQENTSLILGMQQNVSDQIDKSSWDLACRGDRVRAAFADRVEDLFRAERAQGRVQSREILFKYLYGEEVDRQRSQKDDRQRRDAATRVRRETVRPANARSDAARPSTRQPADEYEAALNRVRNQPLW